MDADWTFKGSTDGEHWECLHQGQEDCYIGQLSVNTWEILADRLSINVDTGVLNNEQRAYLTDQAEERLRGTWVVPDNKLNGFYRFFRIQKVGDKGCLHATSFEFFGDVNECPDDKLSESLNIRDTTSLSWTIILVIILYLYNLLDSCQPIIFIVTA